MLRSFFAFAFLLVTMGPASAARPLLDRHEWDAYFALFARDANVPWKAASVRLDTYSGAPVDFAAYEVDPAEVIVAGPNRPPRAIATAQRTATVRWRFMPPAGYRFVASDVDVPLGGREGFFVIEARRGDAVQQVWLNRTHIGLLTKESPGSLIVWAVDLRTGLALPNLGIAFLAGGNLIDRRTDANGLVDWRDRVRPTFALAASGHGRAFVSLLPQAPLPASVVGIRLDTAGARSGERVRFAGFVRNRSGGGYRRGTGIVKVTLLGRGSTLAVVSATLDAAGAFSGEMSLPLGLPSGEYTILAASGGSVGGTSLHVDAAGDVTLNVRTFCPCAADRDLPLSIVASHGDVPAANLALHLEVIRTPHILAPGSVPADGRWGTTVVVDRVLHTDAAGISRVTIESPSDGLDSTYGLRISARGATVTERLAVATARVALALAPVQSTVDVGAPIAFDLRGFDAAGGEPAAGLVVNVRLSHGASSQTQQVALDPQGRARVVFHGAGVGSNLAVADALVDGRHALDAAAVLVEPNALSGVGTADIPTAGITLDRERYRPHAPVTIRATEPGASGEALLTLEGVRVYAIRRTGVDRGSLAVSLPLGEPQGAVRAAAAFVRDGAIVLGAADVHVDAPGHARLLRLATDRATYRPGEAATVNLEDGDLASGATIVTRVADGVESGAARFDDAPGLLDAGATTSQTSAAPDVQWHSYVAPARSRAADIFAAERPRRAALAVPTIGAATPRTLAWHVARAGGGPLKIPVPKAQGHYVLSVLEIADDGDVGAASIGLTVAGDAQ